MNKENLSSIMSEFAFTYVGEIIPKDDYPSINLEKINREMGWVYLWIEENQNNFSIVYVGMAGKTLKSRFSQHNGGFRRSSSGKAHAKRLLEGFRLNKRYLVYGRKCNSKSILGEENIPMQCIEELAFIQKFKPLWNTA